jgi:hypothetical protein
LARTDRSLLSAGIGATPLPAQADFSLELPPPRGFEMAYGGGGFLVNGDDGWRLPLQGWTPLWSPFAGGWQCSTFIFYETPAATEGRSLKRMNSE